MSSPSHNLPAEPGAAPLGRLRPGAIGKSRQVPGGIVSATFVPGPDGAEHVVLAGPAEIVARGVFA